MRGGIASVNFICMRPTDGIFAMHHYRLSDLRKILTATLALRNAMAHDSPMPQRCGLGDETMNHRSMAPWNWDQTDFDTACEAVYDDDDRMVEIYATVAEAEDGGELVAIVTDAYGVMKALTDGKSVHELSAGQLDHLAALWRASDRLCSAVREAVEQEVLA